MVRRCVQEVETEFRQIQDAVREKESEAAGTRVKLKAVHNELAKILASAAEVRLSVQLLSAGMRALAPSKSAP